MQKKNIFILTLILILLINYIATASDWRVVEEFDNTPTWSKSNVQSINCWDSINCYAIVQHATKEDYGCRIYTSSNNGISWELLFYNENGNPQMLNVKAGVSPHSNYYFILSDDNTFLEKSTDGGKTFKIITLEQNNNYPDNIAMYDTSIGLAINSSTIYITKDGWENFERHTKLSIEQVFYSPIFKDSNTVVMTYVANIRWNDSKGFAFVKYHLNENKWDTISYFGRDSNNWIDAVKNLYFINDTLGFGCGTRNDSTHDGNYFDIIYKTTDGGNNWKLIHKEFKYPQIGFYNNISFFDEKNGIAVGFYGKIAMTNDGGETWVYEPTPNAMDNCRKMLVCWAGRTPLIGTWDAGIFRYEGDFFKFPVGVEDREITNYEIRITPNPASEYIEINFWGEWRREKGEGTSEIRIFDVYGKEITNLRLDKKNTPLTPLERGIGNGVMIDVSYFPIGIYFMRYANKTYNFIKY